MADTIISYKEELAILDARRKGTQLRLAEFEGQVSLKERELRDTEAMLASAKSKREALERDCRKLSLDMKEARDIGSELQMLRKSRDMAAAEAMRAEQGKHELA